MRIPVTLSAAAALAVDELGLARSTTGLTADALRTGSRRRCSGAALDQHYHEHPESRPELADVAVAAAQLDGHPLAATPDVIRTAAAEVAERHSTSPLMTCCCGPRPGRCPPRRRLVGMAGRTPPHLVLLDNEAVQALADPRHRKHRTALAVFEVVAQRKKRGAVVDTAVPTGVRVEAGWDRTGPGAAFLNLASHPRHRP